MGDRNAAPTIQHGFKTRKPGVIVEEVAILPLTSKIWARGFSGAGEWARAEGGEALFIQGILKY
jgi:hypothetical protein